MSLLKQPSVLVLVVVGQGAEPFTDEALHADEVVDGYQHPRDVEVGEDRDPLGHRRRRLQPKREPGLTQ